MTDVALPRFRRSDLWAMLCTFLLAIVAFIVVTPLFFLLLSSFDVSIPGEKTTYDISGWIAAFSAQGVLKAIYNTVSLAVTRSLIAVVIAIFLSWLLARTDIPLKGWFDFMFWLSFFLPTLPVALGWILLLDPQYGLLNQLLLKTGLITEPIFNIYSYWGIIWVHLTSTTVSLQVMLLTPAFRNLDAAFEEASRVNGANSVVTLLRIVVPVMMPTILVVTTLSLIRSLEAFEIELILGVPVGIDVFSTKIYAFVINEPPDYASAAALGSLFFVLLLGLLALQHLYLKGKVYATLGGRGFSTGLVALKKWRVPAFLLLLAIVLIITVVPASFVFLGTFMKLFGYFSIDNPWTLDNWHDVLHDPALLNALWNTLVLGGWAALIGIVFCALIAYTVVKTRYAGRTLLDFLSWLPYAIPGVLLGLTLVWFFLSIHRFVPIYGTMAGLIVAMVISRLPLGVQIIKSSLMQLGNELEEASRVAGASWLNTCRYVVVPLLGPCLVVVGLLMFISAVRDISTVALLATGKTRTLSLLMLDYASGAELERATVVASIICMLVIAGALAARSLGNHLNMRG